VSIGLAMQGNLTYPAWCLGSRRARMGPRATRHLSHAVCVIHAEHGRLRGGWEGEWEGGKGDPNDTPKPSRRVGWGIGVCTQASWGPQARDGWRRPLAFGKQYKQ
jgi:hypothetical protein